jgi:hypothetical protein
MQQTNRKKPDSGVLNGIKIVLASGAVAGAVGIWSMLAGNAMNDVNLQGQDQGNTGLADLPTLIPLADVQASLINPVSDPSSTGLRSVTVPTQSATLQSPIVQPMILGAPSSSGGAVSGSAAKPKRAAARTRSSRKR